MMTTARYIAVTLCMFLFDTIADKANVAGTAETSEAFYGKQLRCAIAADDGSFGTGRLATGFNYELLKMFADGHNCSISIVSSRKGENYRDSLLNGDIDLIVTPTGREEKDGRLLYSKEIGDSIAWAATGNDYIRIKEINRWLSHFSSTDEFTSMQKRFFSAYNPFKKAEKGLVTGYISPYDGLIKKYASGLGWDWRMLAAVIYQESMFSINSVSRRGATGLMQVMPSTGRYYGISDLLDPEMNITAGTRHLARLQKMFSGTEMADLEKIKFTLASYNAGEGRIADCISLAASKGLDSRIWDNIAGIIPEMRDESSLDKDIVKLGKFNGVETIAYVDNVLAIYDAFCRICPEK